MSIKNNLTFVIVTYESDKVIDDCILSIPSNYPIIIIENSGNENFKKEIEKKEEVEWMVSVPWAMSIQV